MELVFEVTVTVVIQITLSGVLVILILVTEAVVPGLFKTKNGGSPEPSSFFAATSIVTPCAGMTEVIVTVNGKSVPGAAGCVEFAGGFNVTCKVGSPPPPPPPPLLFLQLPPIPKINVKKINT